MGVISWVNHHADKLRIYKNDISLVRDSAEGNLAIVCALNDSAKQITQVSSIYGALDLINPSQTFYHWNLSSYPMNRSQKAYITSIIRL
ncbi:hypothetical protein SAMN02982927_02788 [Sporolactobacillus nakayamae]|uniref:Uncharacterized protein n=2 Tax=Sporolactobacillus nakayamae TaxID=269670 RepID=A0A1I2UQ91_9BACL|nr:hypothetical protein SAMN02982927_02788 [Sporolactobacillus nakayamae]